MNEEVVSCGIGSLPAVMERVIIAGNLADLLPAERISYYRLVCQSLGLNPLTRPFDYIELDGKLTLYATRGATDQLRRQHQISILIAVREEMGDIYRVVAIATDPRGRTDEAEGVVSLVREKGEWRSNERTGKRYFQGSGQWERLRGEELAKARMRAETKAKRRVTLSICGLHWLDESERDILPRSARAVPVDLDTGEILVPDSDPGLEVAGRGSPPDSDPGTSHKMTDPQHRAIEARIDEAGLDRERVKAWLADERLLPPGGHLTDLSKRVAVSVLDRWGDVLRRYQEWEGEGGVKNENQ